MLVKVAPGGLDKNGSYFADNISVCQFIFLNENGRILNQISLKIVPKDVTTVKSLIWDAP